MTAKTAAKGEFTPGPTYRVVERPTSRHAWGVLINDGDDEFLADAFSSKADADVYVVERRAKDNGFALYEALTALLASIRVQCRNDEWRYSQHPDVIAAEKLLEAIHG